MKTLFMILLGAAAGCNLLETTPVRSADGGMTTADMRMDIPESDSGTVPVEDMALSELEKLCSDGLKNGTESDFDCGGRCRPCADNRACIDSRDCVSEICGDGICGVEVKTCENGILDGNETKIDCGGSDCDACQFEGEAWWQPEWNRRQVIEFQTVRRSEKTRVLISLEEMNTDVDPTHVRFVMNETLLESERDGASSFWVQLPDLDPNDHTMYVYTEASNAALSPTSIPWSDDFAIFHAPHEKDVLNKLGAPVSTAEETTGVFNTATEFDGTNHVVLSDVDQKLDELSRTFTISAWIKPTVGMGIYKIIVSRQLAEDTRDDFAFGLANGRLIGCAQENCVSGSPIPLDVWSNVAFVHNGQTGTLYLNGKIDGSKTLPRIAVLKQNDLVIGGNQNFANASIQEHFYGKIDELRMTTNVLSADTLLTQFESRDRDFFIFGDSQTLTD